MDRRLTTRNAAVIGLFSVVSLALATIGLFSLATRDGWASETVAMETAMSNVQGLRPGTRVRLLGIPVGQVTSVQPPSQPEDPVLVKFVLDKNQAPLVRTDAKTRIVKDGLVGERVLEIVPGSNDAAVAKSGSRLESFETPDWSEVLEQVGSLAQRITAGEGTAGKLLTEEEIYDSVKSLVAEGQDVVAKLDNVIARVEAGEGTAGRLVNSDEAYEALKALVQKAEVVLGSVDESHRSLRGTWPVRNFVSDRYKVLVRPDAQAHRRVFKETDLFPPDKAVLTNQGKAKLDEIAAWLHEFDEFESDVVIAAFARDREDGRLAEQITQKQAEAVRDHLIGKGAHRKGWVSRRDIDGYGFGNSPSPVPGKGPDRRIEITAFVK